MSRETVNWLVAPRAGRSWSKCALFRFPSLWNILTLAAARRCTHNCRPRPENPAAPARPLYQDVANCHRQKNWNTRLTDLAPPADAASPQKFTPAMRSKPFLMSGEAKPEITSPSFFDVCIPHQPGLRLAEFDIESETMWCGRSSKVSLRRHCERQQKKFHQNHRHRRPTTTAQGAVCLRLGERSPESARSPHLRFGPEKRIQSTYLIRKANFVAVHQFGFLRRYDVLAHEAEEGNDRFLLNAPITGGGPGEHGCPGWSGRSSAKAETLQASTLMPGRRRRSGRAYQYDYARPVSLRHQRRAARRPETIRAYQRESIRKLWQAGEAIVKKRNFEHVSGRGCDPSPPHPRAREAETGWRML